MLNQKPIIVLLGPTASGKSSFSVQIAKKIGGEIVSADSRQIYKGMDIGSGKITRKEMRGIPHHLLDIANPKRTFTASQYQTLAQKAIRSVWKRGKIPIVCGGTGFYIRGAVEGLQFPKTKPNPLLRKKLEAMDTNTLFQILRKKDLKRAKTIDSKNRRRLIRALEIVEHLGKVPPIQKNPISEFVLYLGIQKDKEELKQRIRVRLLKRMRNGLIKEVKNLHENGISWKRLESFGLEYRYIAHYLKGNLTKNEMIVSLLKEIEQYAKRQMTWFRKNPDIIWVQDSRQTLKVTKNYLEGLSHPKNN